MRCISHYRKYAVGILTRRTENTLGGEIELVPGYVARFQQGDLTAEELEFAERTFSPNGRTYEADMVTPTKLIGRLSTYDTESELNLREFDAIDSFMEGKPIPGDPTRAVWERGDMKKMTEYRLRMRAERSQSFKIFEPPPLSPPWPTYDRFQGSAEELAEKVVEDGFHIPQVVAYERQNQNRESVIIALSAPELETAQPEFVS